MKAEEIYRRIESELKQFTYKVKWYAPDKEYVATCDRFPNLSNGNENIVSALDGLINLIRFVIMKDEFLLSEKGINPQNQEEAFVFERPEPISPCSESGHVVDYMNGNKYVATPDNQCKWHKVKSNKEFKRLLHSINKGMSVKTEDGYKGQIIDIFIDGMSKHKIVTENNQILKDKIIFHNKIIAIKKPYGSWIYKYYKDK